MQPQKQHEFDFDQEQVVLGLTESLYRFAIMSGVVGLALVGLGAAVLALGAYGGGLAGAGIVALGLVAAIGSLLFLRPRSIFTDIVSTQGSDMTNLMHGLKSLTLAHGTLRWILVIIVLIRLGSFLATRLG